MEASRLLLASVIKEKICAYLSFEDVVNLRDALGLSSLKVPILVTDSKSSKEIILPGVNPTTIKTYKLIKQRGCDLAFIKAARTGKNSVVQTLLTAGIDVNVTDPDGWTALITAACCGQNLVVQTLLAANEIHEGGHIALILAGENGYDSIVKILLTVKNIGVNDPDWMGWKALMLAAYHNRNSVVQALLTAKDININVTSLSGWTSLMLAAENGHIEVVQTLLTAKDIDINAVNQNGQTALMLASENGLNEVVQTLKTAGAL